jgi:hypothetical protein
MPRERMRDAARDDRVHDADGLDASHGNVGGSASPEICLPLVAA